MNYFCEVFSLRFVFSRSRRGRQFQFMVSRPFLKIEYHKLSNLHFTSSIVISLSFIRIYSWLVMGNIRHLAPATEAFEESDSIQSLYGMCNA